ncbi:type II secretion system protein [Kiritimatiellaeota bacterium B1221]|nr:type II secretion system protein [Kiritimatiellaeota bacterium B1221]
MNEYAKRPHPETVQTTTSCCSPGKSAFTLIEMLVVITIIALMVSMLVPATQNVLERGKMTQTMSNMKSVGELMLSYASENNGHFPWTNDGTTGNYYTQSWRNQILTYAGGVKSHYMILDAPSCPFRPDVKAFGQAANCGFSMNQYLGRCNSSGIATKGKSTARTASHPNGVRRPSMGDFVRPSKSFIIASAGEGGSWNGNSYTHTELWNPWFSAGSKDLDDYLPISKQVDMAGGLGYWVMDGAAMLMVDGHVERVPRGSVTWGHFYPF